MDDFAENTIEENNLLELKKRQLEVSKLELEAEKLKIELHKIDLEKKELQKKWYKKPAWWSVFVPLIIGLGTIYIAFSTGIINIEQLKREKKGLEDTIASYKTFLVTYKFQRDSLKNYLLEQRIKLDKTNTQLASIQLEKSSLEKLKKSQSKNLEAINKEFLLKKKQIELINIKQKEINNFFSKEYIPTFSKKYFTLFERDGVLKNYTLNKKQYEELLSELTEAFTVAFQEVNNVRQAMIDSLYKNQNIQYKNRKNK